MNSVLRQGYIAFSSTIQGDYFRSFEAYSNVIRLNINKQ